MVIVRCLVSVDLEKLNYVCIQISTLEILNPEDQGALLSDDEIFSSRQTAKHTCMALRRYFEAHLAIKVEQVKQSLQRTEGGAPIHPQPYYKVLTTIHSAKYTNYTPAAFSQLHSSM